MATATFTRVLVVKIEVWPGGRRAQAREIARAAAANVSELADISDYVAVLEDDTGHTSAVHLEGHPRAAGVWPLVARIAQSRGTAERRAPLAEEWADLAGRLGERMRERRSPSSP